MINSIASMQVNPSTFKSFRDEDTVTEHSKNESFRKMADHEQRVQCFSLVLALVSLSSGVFTVVTE